MRVGHRSSLVVVDERGWRLHYSHWAANGIYRRLAAGPDAALAFVGAQQPTDEWLDDTWAEGAVLVDTVARRLVWYGNDMMIDLPNRRAFTRLLAETWPGWRVDWAFDGIGDIAAYVGVDRAAVRSVDPDRLTAAPALAWELDDLLLADDAEPEVNLQGSYRLLTVRTGDGVRSWVLDHPDDGHPAWLGPGLLERLPGPGHPRVRLAGLPDVGLHLDVPARTAGAWVGWTCPGLLAEFEDRWPGWTVAFWGDGVERQVEAAGGTVVVPVVDEARALAGLARSLTRHTDPLASFAESVGRMRAEGRTVEVNPAAWQHTDTALDDADRDRVARALERLTGPSC